MKHLVIVLFAIGLCFSASAQGPRKAKGNGRVMEKERRLPEFDRIEIIGNIDVTLLNNDYQKRIIFNGDLNLQALIKSKVENGTLILTYDNNIQILSQTEPLKVRIPSKSIKEIILKNGAKLTNMGAIEILQLKIHAFDNSTANLKLKADEVFINIENEAQLKFDGSANSVKINHNGTFDLDNKELSNFFTEIELNNSGNIYTNTVNGIDGNINGSGNLYYKATKTINVTENGTGKIEKY